MPIRNLLWLLCCSGWVMALSVQSDTLSDPTRPLNYQTQVAADKAIILNSILWGDQRQVAIINGQQVREGDVLTGAEATVISISPKYVEIKRGQAIIRLSLPDTLKVRQ